jgi:hypothetical protein
VYLDDQMQILDMPGKTLVIRSDSLDNKYDALYNVLKRLLEVQAEFAKKRVKTSLPNSTSSLDMMILIPEGLVALVIGGKGR